MIKSKTLAAWALALVMGATPAVGLGQDKKDVAPNIPEEIKQLLPKGSEGDEEKKKEEQQSLPEPIRDENTVPLTKEVPS